MIDIKNIIVKSTFVKPCRRTISGGVFHNRKKQEIMATIKGENLRILVGPDTEHLQCIAAATSCVVHLALQLEEDTTKDVVDDWINREPVGINWDVQADALIISDDDDEYRPGAKAIDQLQVGMVYVIRFSRTAGAAGEQNRDAVADEMQLTGSAILSDLNINAQNAELATAVAQFTGTGDLTPYTPPTE